LLVETGVNLNVKDHKGNSALDYAHLRLNDAIAQLLLDAGADANREVNPV
jgi:ankyrin repeat protein